MDFGGLFNLSKSECISKEISKVLYVMELSGKGIFPLWMSDEEIITQLLKQIISNDGSIAYTYVINLKHNSDTQKRMENILAIMYKENVLFPCAVDNDDLVINGDGRLAARLGFQKFKRIRIWRKLFKKVKKSRYILLFLFLLLALGLIIFHVV